MLKSWNVLHAENSITEDRPIGSLLGDPADFSDYIMFGGGVTGEVVVRAKETGKITMDLNSPYMSGARMYFDAKKMAEDGHDLGNHGDNHKKMSRLTKEECVQEIRGMHTKVRNLTGQEMWLFRPPYGDYNDTVLEAAEDCGYMTVQWDVDSLDWKDYGAQDIIERVTEHKNLRNGSILLLHTGTAYTAQALDGMLSGLEEKGYRFVPLSELLLKENYTIDHEGRQHPDSNV